MSVLEVDRNGLAKKLANRPKAFVLYELVQNAWDEDSTEVRIELSFQRSSGARSGLVAITVKDDSPDGFADLRSIYTLFRDSKKAPDPTKRGRFELGEKLIIALADYVRVETTKGTITISGNERTQSRARRQAGSSVEVQFRATLDEYEALRKGAELLIPPKPTYLDGILLLNLSHRCAAFEAPLDTIVSDEAGALVHRTRKTEVRVYTPAAGARGWVFEMGIPIVETGDAWHYDVQQRVPVNWERNNLPAAFLKTLRVEALNHLHAELPHEEAGAPWVTSAIDDPRCEADALGTIVKERFGEKAVVYDPSDPEGTKLAVSQGYTVVTGGALPATAWENIRRHATILPAGQVTPSPKPYSQDGRPEREIPRDKWTPDMGCRAIFCEELAVSLNLGRLEVVIVNEPKVYWQANFGRRGDGFRLCLNYGRLGKVWFAMPHHGEPVLSLLIHELAHAESSDHLSEEYHRALCNIGARVTMLALKQRELFEGKLS